MIRYREGVNVLDMLARCDFTAYELRKQRIMGESRIQKLRKGALPSWNELDFICDMTATQPADIIEFVRDKETIN